VGAVYGVGANRGMGEALSTFAKLGEWRGVRLPMWGRWRWADLMADAPDGSCANSIWDNFVWHDDAEGYGDVAEAVMVEQAAPAKAEQEPIDEDLAETTHGWILQLSPKRRALLSKRFVMRQYVPPDEVDGCIYAILDLMGDNRRVVERMRHG
jgi:hypothetical protein